MINKFEVSGVHTNVTPELQKYLERKIGKLDRYLPKSTRESAHAEVFIKQTKNKTRVQHTCEVIMKLKQETLTVKETTMNPFAAVDIVEEKLKNQLRDYKEKHTQQRFRNKVLARLRRQTTV